LPTRQKRVDRSSGICARDNCARHENCIDDRLLLAARLAGSAKRDRPIDVEVAPLALDHASLIARSTGRSFSFYAKLESVHAVRSTQQRSILTGDA